MRETIELPEDWAGGQIRRSTFVTERYDRTGYPRQITVIFTVDDYEEDE